MQRDLSSLELLEAVGDIYLGEQTGLLAVDPRGSAPARLHFDRGLLVAALGSEAAESPWDRLQREGTLDAATLEAARQERREPIEVLSELVDAGTLRQAVRGASLAVISRVVTSPQLEATFTETAPPSGYPDSDVLFTAEAILQGVQEAAGFAPFAKALLRLDARVRLKSRRAVPLERLGLDARDGFLLSRLDGSLTLQEAVSALPPGEEEGSARFVLALALLGVAGFDPPVGEGRFRLRHLLEDRPDPGEDAARKALLTLRERFAAARTDHEALGVPEKPDPETVRRSAESLREVVARARSHPRLLRDHRKDIQLAEARIAGAVAVLGRRQRPVQGEGQETEIDWERIQSRREYEKTETRVSQETEQSTAEAYYYKAKNLFGMKDYHSCIQYCGLAIKIRDDVAAYHHLLGTARAMNPDHRWQKKAEADFSRACELDPFNADYLVSLARLYKAQGLALRARRTLERALEILPGHEEAQVELRGL
jgi:tetratricopeptide (TPR) repeat protein